ncbi:isopentenyl-adenosine tRNA methylthiolase [Candidatus Carsonella ruddii CS isolate Thao2000]|uniref:tRNA-2-methylthio-N(6)-dimethylallyladenosine synthase n=1 Tax=Candidatus Carsonella ruddii CS isolate Thao2000 TaxID=1202537 RepID=J7GSP1_CARRU|nr:MiaB/RimO family radical SAM methylthiotransferase [Candidatus Carsonella ruddii]AFP83772.1 isopentenyl-adenosine tRNA methylthiolase [Candidatus Carsonella ruddii CS isolate Thao2000]
MFFHVILYIKTFGCNINNFESNNILKIIFYFKILLKKKLLNSDLIIINSCVIRKNPQLKIFKIIKKIIFLKKYKKNLIILTGCLTETENLNFLKIIKVDIIFNSLSVLYIIKIIKNFFLNKKKIIFIKKNKLKILNKISTYLNIMSGCNHNCSYCIIPQIKGKESYLNYKKIFNFIIKNLKKKNCEITLLGQNVNSYKYNKINFSSLIFNISKIKNIKRINFLSSNLFDFNKKFLILYKNLKKISNHLHLPIQSGSNFILKIMNRKYSIKKYLIFTKKIKKIKFTTLSTDIIISYPKEKFIDFDYSLKILKKIKFLNYFCFLYSKRKNTLSYNFQENNNFLKFFKLKIFQKNKNNYFILLNKKIRVLVIGYIKKNIFIGKMDNFKLIFFEYYNYNIIGKFIFVKVIDIKKNIFLGIYESFFNYL